MLLILLESYKAQKKMRKLFSTAFSKGLAILLSIYIIITIHLKNNNLANRSSNIPRFFWYAAGIVTIYFVLNQLNILPSLRNLFRSKQVTIDSTPVLIKEVKNIAQLMTMSSYDEVVVDSSKSVTAQIPGLTAAGSLEKESQLVIIGKGQVVAGIDLQELDEKRIYLKDDSVSIILPPAKVLDAIVNPSQYEIFIEEKGWEAADVNQLKILARDIMVQRSVQQGLLKKADAKARMIMENFLKSIGFKRISVK